MYRAEAEFEKQEAAHARDRESIEAEFRARQQMAMEAELESRSSAKVLARNGEFLAHKMDSGSPTPSEGNGYSLRKREPKNYTEERLFGTVEKKTPKSKKSIGSSATPKTPKSSKTVKTPRTPKSTRGTTSNIKSPVTPTPNGLARSILANAREATFQRFPRVAEETLPVYPKFVRFSVGPSEYFFAIPLQYLELECDFFRTEFSTFRDKDIPMDFPEFDLRAFTMFTTWIYSNQLKELEGIGESSFEFSDLVRLYHIAEKFQAVVLKNVVIDLTIGLFNKYNGWVQFAVADEVYASTVIGSPLRRLWVEFRVRGEGVEQGILQLNGEFLTDVVERQRQILNDNMRGFTIGPIDGADYYDVEAGTGRTHGRIPFF